MLTTKLNAQQRLHPSRCVSPSMRYHPNQVLHHHFCAQGRYGETGIVPSVIICVLCISWQMEKEFSRAKKGGINERTSTR